MLQSPIPITYSMDAGVLYLNMAKHNGDSFRNNCSDDNDDSDDYNISENKRTFREWFKPKISSRARDTLTSNREAMTSAEASQSDQRNSDQSGGSKQGSNISSNSRHLVQRNIMNVRNDDNQSNIDGIDDGDNDTEAEYRAWKRSKSMAAKSKPKTENPSASKQVSSSWTNSEQSSLVKTTDIPSSKKVSTESNSESGTDSMHSDFAKPTKKGNISTSASPKSNKKKNKKAVVSSKPSTEAPGQISDAPKPKNKSDRKGSVSPNRSHKGNTHTALNPNQTKPSSKKVSTESNSESGTDSMHSDLDKPTKKGNTSTSASPKPNKKDSVSPKRSKKGNTHTALNSKPSYSTSTISSNQQIRKRSNRKKSNHTSPQNKSSQSQPGSEQDTSETEPSNQKECNEKFKEAVAYLSERCPKNYIISEVEKLKQMEKCINACGRQNQPTSCECQEDKQSCVKQRQTSNECDVDQIETCAADPPCDLDKFTRWSKEIFSLCSLPREKNIVIKMACANAQNDDCVEDTSTDSQQICKSDLFIDGTGNTRRLKICIDSDPANDPQTSQECESECECERTPVQCSEGCTGNMKSHARQAHQTCRSYGGFCNESHGGQILYFCELVAIIVATMLFVFILVTFE